MTTYKYQSEPVKTYNVTDTTKRHQDWSIEENYNHDRTGIIYKLYSDFGQSVKYFLFAQEAIDFRESSEPIQYW